MKFELDFFKCSLAALLAYLLILFIALRIQNNSNYKRKALLTLIVMFVILVFNGIAIFIDFRRFGFTQEYFDVFHKFYAFPIVATIMLIVLPTVFFIIGCSRKQAFVNIHEKYHKQVKKEMKKTEVSKPTIKDEIEYLYLAFRYEGNFLLKEVNTDGNIEYGGLVVKFHKNDFFHDEYLQKVIESFNLDVIDYKLNGVVTQKKNDNSNNKYYVYCLELNSVSSTISDLKSISPVVMYNFNLSEFNKQVLYHVVLRDYFEIEVE